MKIAGLDIGTTGCKCTVFDETGAQLDRAYRNYPVTRASGAHEVDARAILSGTLDVLRSIAARHPDVAGIGVTSFGETFVLADAQGNALSDALLYTDPRGAEECRALEESLGARRIADIAGVKPHEMYSLPKLMWIKKHRPELYKQAAHIFLVADYVVFALTGVAQIDYSLASRTMGFDVRRLAWSEELFAAAGIDISKMSRPAPSGTTAGCIRPEIAAETGLSPRTQIVTISHDQVAAAVGAGVFTSGLAVDGAGTVECITPVFDGIPDMAAMCRGSYAVVPYVLPGKYVCYAFSYTGGALLQWCVDALAGKEKAQAEAQGLSINALLESGADTPSDLLVLPHFAGAATPYMDTGSRGAILGLTTATTVQDIYRACMESVALEMRLNLDHLEASGICPTHLNAAGGGARSRVWMQMKADVLNLPITALSTVDAGTAGSAMLTGVAVGAFRDLSDAAARLVRPETTFTPRADMHARYSEIYQRYRNLYNAVRPLMD